MKVVILCGGLGTRFKEETEYKPKPMIEIGGKPILWHIMKIYSHFGFNDFILCLGYKQNIIREYFLNYEFMNNDFTINIKSREKIIYHSTHNENWKVSLIDTGLETKKGTRIKRIEPYIKEDRFMVTYGDGVGNINIKKLIDFHSSQGKTATFTGVQPTSRFATVDLNDKGKIISWSEKKKLEDYINAGFFVLERKIFDYLTDNCELEEEPMSQLAKEEQVAMYKHNDFWHCMDTYRDFMVLQNLWKKGKAPWAIW
ncbi:MAG: glucose-1-phosphate cytidylyltransferase [Candidatus Aminicenantes bacterium]|nr:glucose-1-phosphate cytidylyltransferase [Candidatus Aminicenantes bacterium]